MAKKSTTKTVESLKHDESSAHNIITYADSMLES